ncbi:hypothetical protein GALL_454870 [mine drainage metagenome]|uniref:Uncharacterized protein n=1 Tax=mine drainage metagenome TaxID=410659 RepID=A0A1J5Q5Z5_9ZZZZ
MKDPLTRFGHHPWLMKKLQYLRELDERDPDMMVKTMRISDMRMSTRSPFAFCRQSYVNRKYSGNIRAIDS